MTAHPMTSRARALGAESDEGWLINSLCDALDKEHTEKEAALADLADGGAATSTLSATEWGTDYWGDIMSEPTEEYARNVARDGKSNLYSRPPMGRWFRVESYEATQ